MIYWILFSGSYFLVSSNLEKCGKFWIRPDCRNTAQVDTAGMGSIGLMNAVGSLLKQIGHNS